VGKIVPIEVEVNILVGIAVIDCANDIVKQRIKQMTAMKENGSEKFMIEQLGGLDRWYK